MAVVAALSLWLLQAAQGDPARELIDRVPAASWQDFDLFRQVRDAAPGIVKLLAHEDPGIRRQAAAALGAARVTTAGPSLVPLLRDPSGEVRTSAALALGRMGNREAIPALVPLLGDGRQGYYAYQPTNSLREMGAQEAVPRFIELLKEGDPSYRASCCSVLMDLGGREAISALRDVLEGDDPWAAEWVTMGLARLGDRESVPALRRLLDRPGPGPRSAAAAALLELGDRQRLPDILRLLDHDEDRCGCEYTLIPALASLGADEAIPLLTARLKDARGAHRAGAAATLGSLGARDSVPAIAALLADPSTAVQLAAARALSGLEARGQIPAIEVLLDRADDPKRRAELAACLLRLGSDKGVPVLLEGGGNLGALNLLRRKDAWDALSKLQFPTVAGGVPLETLLTRLETQAGLSIDWPVRAIQPRCGATRALSRGREKAPRTSAFDSLEATLRYGRFEIILEPGKIRIVSHDEALTFWREWHKEEQRKDKK